MLKVGSPQPQMDMMSPMAVPNGGMPPMEDPMMMGGDPNGGMPPMEEPMMGNDMGDGSEFDSNFDAGVDADENSDPKKYIQQLTGKLSQSLRKYNQNLPQPEADLCKYVAGMILKQTTEGLTDSEKKEIIDKVNGNKNDNNSDVNDGDEMDNSMMMGNEEPMMESINPRSIVNEIFQELMQKRDNTNYDIADRPIKNVGFRKKPFTSPKMN